MASILNSEDLRFFLCIVTSPSLAAAARALDVTPSAVTQRLRGLEDRLGMPLLERCGGHLEPTAEGRYLAARGSRVLDELESVTSSLISQRGRVAGHLRIAAPLGFGRRFVARVATPFVRRYPSVTIDLALSDCPNRIAETSWDVLIHVGELPDSSRRVVTVAPNARFLVAAPAYVAARGEPISVADLKSHACLALRENQEDVTLWRFQEPDGSHSTVRIKPRLSSNDGEVMRSWALAGRGLMIRSEWAVADDIAVGRLVRLMPDRRPPDADVVALFGARRGASALATAFVRHLKGLLQPPPWRAAKTLYPAGRPMCSGGSMSSGIGDT